MRLLITLVSIAAIGLALTIAVAGPATRLGVWEYGTGLTLIWNVSRPVTIIEGFVSLSPIFTAAALSLLGGLFAFVCGARALGMFAIIAALAAGGAGLVPVKMKELIDTNPFIHDITTDFANPPPVIAGAGFDRKNSPEYVGDEKVRNSEMAVAEAQRAAFPDIKTKRVNAPVNDVVETVRAILTSMDMEILSETPMEAGRLMEATYTSTWFGFIDDFVVRLQPEGDVTLIDVRSKSRVGKSDLGANARRVRMFFEKIDAARLRKLLRT